MAKKRAKKSVNKSVAIRKHVEKFPEDGPSAISEALAKRGIKVTPGFVSTVRSNDRRKAGAPKRRKARRTEAAGSLDDATIMALKSAKKLVDEAGSVAAAKAALENYGKLFS